MKCPDSIDIAMEEYKALWKYYQTLVGEWNRFIEAYLKVVTLPAGIIGFFSIFLSDRYRGSETPILQVSLQYVFAASFGIICLVGISLYIGYAKECRNGNSYEQALSLIRDFLCKMKPELQPVLVIDGLRTSSYSLIPGSIKFWRGSSMLLINSGIGTLSIAIGLTYSSIISWLILFTLFIATHVGIFVLIIKDKKLKDLFPTKVKTE